MKKKMKETITRINKIKSWFFEKMDGIGYTERLGVGEVGHC